MKVASTEQFTSMDAVPLHQVSDLARLDNPRTAVDECGTMALTLTVELRIPHISWCVT